MSAQRIASYAGTAPFADGCPLPITLGGWVRAGVTVALLAGVRPVGSDRPQSAGR